MLKKIVKPALFLLSSGALGWGGWSIYSSQTPKTLEELVNWKGYVLASFSEDSENIWKAIYEENKEALKNEAEISISEDEGKEHEKIKKWCKENKDLAVEQLPEGKLEKAILYCTSNFKTVKGQLISQGKKLAGTEDEDYKVSTILFSGNSSFSKLISKANTNRDGWYSELKRWCEATFAKSPIESGNNIELAGRWCLKQEHKKLKDRLKAKHRDLIELSEENGGNENNNGYQKKFEAKKQSKTFFDTLNKYKKDGQSSPEALTNKDESKAIERLKEFCKDFKEKNIWEIEDYFGTFALVGTYCYNGNVQKDT